ncbi:MAG: rod shape-determining protein MreD, partial [Paraprevotella sp.]|nr:rod shape-determining protein MreD [Paraprevotella sp.]
EDMVAGYRTLGRWKYVWYVTWVVLLQQAFILVLEVFSFFNGLDMLYTYLSSSALTVLLLLVLERVREK